MNRVRWFEAQLPGGIEEFAIHLGQMPLAVDGNMGFRIERLRRDSVQGIYFERFSWTDRTVDPFGRETSIDRTDYKALRFSITKKFPELELIDFPRGVRSFFSRVAEVTDFETVIKPLKVDVVAWSQALRKYEGLRLRMSGITVSELNVDDGITGRLTLTSRNRDVEDSLVRLLKKRSYSVQRIELTLQGGSTQGPLVIASDGSVRSEREIEPAVLAALKRTVRQGTILTVSE